jgi:uncharacterized protein (DUF4415 family)
MEIGHVGAMLAAVDRLFFGHGVFSPSQASALPYQLWRMLSTTRGRIFQSGEGCNVLQNQGDNFEHNYGHGQHNLSVVFAMVIRLAFLVDQTQQLCAPPAHQIARQRLRLHRPPLLNALGRLLVVVYTSRGETVRCLQPARPRKTRAECMKDAYDFRQGKRGAVLPQHGKTRMTIYIDDDVLEAFRQRAEQQGSGYQTMLNQALREYLARSRVSLDEATLRRVLREELQGAKSGDKTPAPSQT